MIEESDYSDMSREERRRCLDCLTPRLKCLRKGLYEGCNDKVCAMQMKHMAKECGFKMDTETENEKQKNKED